MKNYLHKQILASQNFKGKYESGKISDFVRKNDFLRIFSFLLLFLQFLVILNFFLILDFLSFNFF
jgi:hypothetical protein